MLPEVSNTAELLQSAKDEGLYEKLIVQLNKDFLHAGIEHRFSSDITPNELVSQLYVSLVALIKGRFSEYLNLLYIIDVSENKVKRIDAEQIEHITSQVVYLILKREWQKVWFRNNY